ncbi:hypothetical protein PILCRDRAFT_90369 [Piloderma croceum F 1598]|uniref:Uncharacterized protein n=1 Tax=Piloderma croceum (strain F 1598) TaxID=765440 RepID=A0A0C3AYM9_PILCF|nr:hypothetical protein PILCRDRAFT_90369 [Piloderma croceum F 1598]
MRVEGRGLLFFSQPLIGQSGAIPPIGMAMMFLQTDVHFNDVAKSVITPVLETWGHLDPASRTLAVLALVAFRMPKLRRRIKGETHELIPPCVKAEPTEAVTAWVNNARRTGATTAGSDVAMGMTVGTLGTSVGTLGAGVQILGPAAGTGGAGMLGAMLGPAAGVGAALDTNAICEVAAKVEVATAMGQVAMFTVGGGAHAVVGDAAAGTCTPAATGIVGSGWTLFKIVPLLREEDSGCGESSMRQTVMSAVINVRPKTKKRQKELTMGIVGLDNKAEDVVFYIVVSVTYMVLERSAFAFWELAAVSVLGLVASGGSTFGHGGREEEGGRGQ